MKWAEFRSRLGLVSGKGNPLIKMGQTRGCQQFLMLLYKGMLLRKRHYICTIFEIVIPVLIACMLPIIQSSYAIPDSEDSEHKQPIINATLYAPFSPYYTTIDTYSDLQFAYLPTNDITDKIMADAVENFKTHTEYSGNISIHNASSEKDLEDYYLFTQSVNPKLLIIGTVFNNFESPVTSLPDSMDYKIRYGQVPSSFAITTDKKYSFDGPRYYNQYTQTFFLSWQHAVEESFIQSKKSISGNKIDYEIMLQRFPYPEHKRSQMAVSPVPMMIAFGYLVFIINIVRRVIEEKANGSKELMKMMGMTDSVYWGSTFFNYFAVALITSLIITIVYKAPLQNSYVYMKHIDFFILFLMILLFLTSLILFCMGFSIFFNRAVFAIIALIIVYYVSLTLLMMFFFLDKTEINYFPLPLISKLGICLLPPGGLFTMFTIAALYEASEEGVHWYNLTEPAGSPDLHMLMIMLSVLFSCFLYVIIIWYFDAVWPWQPGVPKPFYFLFTKSYWCSSSYKVDNEIELNHTEESSDFFEEEPRGISAGVTVHNLSKEFRIGFRNKLAVNNVSINMYRGQITALLGHNGAGKTTTINILTGLIIPTKGSGSINGRDILTETVSARRGIGVCPQHNVLFDTLTVEEHLKIYAALKGTEWSNLTKEASEVLEMLKLSDKKNELARNLSGGMKRKLCLGNAIIGNSTVLFLDEPTSGMDVEARRSVWDTLLDLRQERTVILTTHYMEEADILGDRIAIMAEGEIQCYGSPMFLKKKFGTGYHLHIVKSSEFNITDTTNLLKQYIPGVTVEKELGNEISYNLQSDSDTNFGDMFEDLEGNKSKLGINSCGITVTTMEDVFLNVDKLSTLKYKSKANIDNGEASELEDSYDNEDIRKNINLNNQLVALMTKRFHYSKRHWGILVTQLLIPFLVLCLCLYVIKNSATLYSSHIDPLQLDINSVYGQTDGFYFDTQDDRITENVIKTLRSNNVQAVKTENPTQYVLDYGRDSLSKYLKNLLVGGSIDKFENGTYNLTAWYNGEPYHALPMSLLMMHSAILKNLTSESASIILTNAPLPVMTTSLNDDNIGMKERILASVFMPLALAFLSASFVLFPIHERVTKAKLLQLMTGLHAVVYWIAMFLWDSIIYFVLTLILTIPFAIFAHRVFFNPHIEAIGVSLLMLLLYGWASIPFSYLISFPCKSGNAGFSVIVAVCCIIGVAVSSILESMRAVNPKANDMGFFRLIPSYCISSGFSKLFAKAYSNAFCDEISSEDLGSNCKSSYMDKNNPLYKCCQDICGDACLKQQSLINWDEDSCGMDLVFLIIDGFIYFSLVLFLETSFSQAIGRYLKHQILKLRKTVAGDIIQSNDTGDTDVVNEEQRIHNLYALRGESVDEAFVAIDLTKIFNNFYAVNHLSFGVHRQECFGLLGVNGAGKTTTFRMLTGDCFPTEGNAFTHDTSLISNLKQFQSHLGYCPQFDALLDRLTGRETLQLFARLRGLSGHDLNVKVAKLIKMTDLEAHADKQTQHYSGGNKRKLSVAMSLVGSPSLILLDEPTAGVDPSSRRKIWSILSRVRKSTKAAIILTSHSMEETEALCSRLAIMVNGRFKCLGSIQQLKSKFGQGYSLIIKLRRETTDDNIAMNTLKEYIETHLSGAELKDDHQGMLQYHIVDTSVTLSHLFKFMCDMKPKYNLEDYLISDTSLEQIFLAFARAQRDS